MEKDLANSHAPIILRSPFLKTVKTIIDVYKSILSIKFGDEVIRFNILDSMKHPFGEHIVLFLLHTKPPCDIDSNLDFSDVNDFDDEVDYVDGLNASFSDDIAHVHSISSCAQISTPSMLSSIQYSPTLELKPLLNNLKYVYFMNRDRLSIIIASNLLPDQEVKLLVLLRDNIKVIGWILAYIPRLSPSTYIYRIFLEDGAKPVRQPQRRLNPSLLEVVKKEVEKLLATGIIYPIFDS